MNKIKDSTKRTKRLSLKKSFKTGVCGINIDIEKFPFLSESDKIKVLYRNFIDNFFT